MRRPLPLRPASPSNNALEEPQPLEPLASPLDVVGSAPPWLVSAAIHMLLMIILGLVFVSDNSDPGLLLRFDYSDSEDPGLGDDIELPLDINAAEFDQTQLLSDDLLQAAAAPEIASPMLVASATPLPSVSVVDPIRMALSGREAGMRDSLLKAYGGNGATQRAVLDGLAWLVRNRRSDGMWDMNGKFAGGVHPSNPQAATGMALIAFQGAGYTPYGDPNEPFTTVVRRAWKGLLASQQDDGSFFVTGRASGRLYTHAICTIAACELYGMTGDSQYREAAQRAIDYCVSCQSPQGGWRYIPREGSDLSVTGWFVIALQSARMAGLEVPTQTLANVSEFLDSVSSRYGSRYAYLPTQDFSRSMTAEGLLCRQFLGWGQDDPRLVAGADHLLNHLPSWESGERDVYYWYYASQVCHHLEGSHWRTWNSAMRRVLPDNQVREGRERGSWDPAGRQVGTLRRTPLRHLLVDLQPRSLLPPLADLPPPGTLRRALVCFW